MEKHYIFHALGQLFKEKRLTFQQAGAPTPAPQGAPAPAPQAAPAPGPATAPETLEQMKDKVGKKIEELKNKLKAVTEHQDDYTKGMVGEVKNIETSIGDIEKQLTSLDIQSLGEEKAKEELKKFEEGLTTLETGPVQEMEQGLVENVEAKTLIVEQHAKLEIRRTELNADEIIEKIMGEIGIDNEDIKTALKKEINKTFGEGGPQKEMDDFLENIKTELDEADKSSLTKQDVEEKIKTTMDILQDPEKTRDGYKTQFEKILEQYTPTVKIYEELKALGGDGQKCKLAKENLLAGVVELINGEKIPDDAVLEKLKKDHTELILIGHVADVINEDPEKIKAALLFYELGKYESEVNSEENKNAKEIIDKIIANKDALKTAGVAIDFLGGTDGTAHGIHKEKEWHEAKVAALQKLVEFSKEDGRIIPPLTLTPEQEALITAYTAAVDGGTAENFVKENKDNFCEGGKLFDMALALQRAEDMKKKINNDPSVELDATDSISLELGSTQNTKTERKSGLKFRAARK